MASCDYYVLQDIYTTIDEKLQSIATTLDELDLSVKIDELDLDLDNLEAQLRIANKLKLLDSIGTDIMSEQDQINAYTDIMNELFVPGGGFGEGMSEEEGD